MCCFSNARIHIDPLSAVAAIIDLFQQQYELLNWMDGSATFNNTFQYIGFETEEELAVIGDLTTHNFFFGILFQTDVSGQPGPLGVSGHQVRIWCIIKMQTY